MNEYEPFPRRASTAPLIILDDSLGLRGFSWRRAGRFAAAMLALCVVLVPVAVGLQFGVRALGVRTSSVFGGVMGGLGAVLFLQGLTVVVRRSFARRLDSAEDALTRSQPPAPPEEVVRTFIACLHEVVRNWGLVGIGSGWNSSAIVKAAERIARHTHGNVIRLSDDPAALSPLPAPLEVEFEPTPFSDRSEAFIELAGRRVAARERVGWALDAFSRTVSRRLWIRRVFTWMMLACIAIGLITFAIQAFQAALGRGRLDFLWGLALYGALIAGLIAWRTLRPRLWLLVPGGAAVLRLRGWFGGWEADVFAARRDTLLFVRELNQVAFASPDGARAMRRVTPAELELLLRVWQSPHAPPSAERLREFAVAAE